MTLALPFTLSSTDAEDGTPSIDRVQSNFDEIAKQFPVSIANASQVPQARVYNSANLVIPTGGANTALTFNTEHWDTASLHDNAVNPSRLTASLAGLWHIDGHLQWAVAAGGTYRYTAIRTGGVTIIAEQFKPPNATLGGQTSLGCDWRLNAGEYVELVVNQDTGANLNVIAAASTSPEFSMHWVSP